MYELLVVLGLVFFTLLIVLRREYGVYLIILLLPTYQIRFSIFNIPVTFLEGMILILAAVSLRDISIRRGGRNIEIKFLIPIGLFLLAAFVSIFVSPVPIKAAGVFKAYFLEPVLFFLLVRAIIDTPEKKQRLSEALSLLVVYLSAFGLYQFITLAGLPASWWAVDVAHRRIISLLNHPNALALLCGPILGLLIFWPKKTRIHWAAVALGLVSLYLTFSRAGWLALAVSVIAVGLLTRARKKIILGTLLAAALVMAIPFSREKILELANGHAPTQENRYVLWTAAADILKRSPVQGAGLMGFHERYRRYPLGPDQVVQNYPHNFFLNFWVETGLLGLLAVVLILFLFFKKLSGQYKLPLMAAMLVILLHGLVDVPYFKNDLAVLFWLFPALLPAHRGLEAD